MSSIHITYSQIQSIPLQLELSLPSSSTTTGPLPLVLFFHGGMLFTGSKKDVLFADWLKDASLKAGFAFAGVDYPLLHPFTANDQIVQIKELFCFLASPDVATSLPEGVQLNAKRIAVAGFSAGGYICRLAAIHATPKPAAIISAYGMGGAFLTDTCVVGNTTFPVVIPRARVAAFVDEPNPVPCVDSPMIFNPTTKAPDDSTGRWSASLWSLVEGTYLDYLTGVPGLSAELRKVSVAERYAKVTEMGLADAFPEIYISQLGKDSAFPPTFVYHGAADPLVLPEESVVTYEALQRAGVKTELRIVEGAVHGMMDPTKGAPHDKAAGLQEEAFQFISRELTK